MSEFRLDGKTALRRLTDIRDLGLLAVLASGLGIDDRTKHRP